MKLPKMPEPERTRMLGYDAIRYVPGWPESYLREFADAYGAACYAAGMDAAAEVCEEVARDYWADSNVCEGRHVEAYRDKAKTAGYCADAIRAAKGEAK